MKTYKQLVEACWKNYKQVGMKDKNGKKVPNCVPVNEELELLDEGRIDFLKDNTKELSTAHESSPEHTDKDKIIDHLSDKADPTKNKAHTGWLVNQYKKGQIRQEDHPQLKDTLSDFEKYKCKLEKKDINQYKDIGEIRQAVNPHVGTASTKKEEADQGHEEIHSEPGLKVYHVKSKEASQAIYGGGSKLGGTHTDWCTGARGNNNMYDNYTRDGDKLITFHKEGDAKSPYQLHLNSNPHHSQFQDKTNSSANLDKFLADHPKVKENPVLKASNKIQFHSDEDKKKRVEEIDKKEKPSDDDSSYKRAALRSVTDHHFLEKHLDDKSTHQNPNLTDEQQDKIANSGKEHDLKSNTNLKPDLIDKHSDAYESRLTRTTKANLLHHIDKHGSLTYYASRSLIDHPKADKEVVNKVYDKSEPQTKLSMLSNKHLDHSTIDKHMNDPIKSGIIAKNEGLTPEHYKKIHEYAKENQLPHIHHQLSQNKSVPKDIHKEMAEMYKDHDGHSDYKDIVKSSTKLAKAK